MVAGRAADATLYYKGICLAQDKILLKRLWSSWWAKCWLLTHFWLQKFFRGRRSVATERSKVRREFCETYGDNCQNVDRYFSFCLNSIVTFFPFLLVLRFFFGNLFNNFSAFRHCFEPGSSFLRQFLFFFKAKNSGDFLILVETCRLLKMFAHSNGISSIPFVDTFGQFIHGFD